ncbi:beta-1,3-galactosyl-O-glycosyl-glycoprotein beta-1,6-N-acetylglucosaminyltransferase 4-like [Ctenopharyngodon idella]|uniref:beta-1,3-galactosyl-O-glycosyl-glycoprotein beta-1,6-N-acetylglucosaminyltransferase 4-like n=1 Tax=Ctenopharyngodon idella TaxID=7959 RepID=UPI00222E9A2B|nr:beta-1,3-galactosyl-O-glycosyl-glycoprotein beta-1,6-N-acetylglucosaminyltransferase 4-like [Ctenopharyngodon idella]XP_051732864.1 beta-1,3-galactosyl-O-glycosyl-glycoprotein beta-1,6-N-acetylglucosaminyltransferase 4-like [Ctenopharyngodon idella]XP_051732865.1 beta-1,3-galactosyl-O-glycosyl-glycoprotein beta-1,6-N-acetylglucosaminyltransferase 4-like [Ctenopharyngodon idella]
MRRLWLHRKLRNVIFIFLTLGLIYCLIIIILRLNKGGGLSERLRLTVKYGINCTAIYEMEPVEVGKTLAIRKQKTYVGETDQTIVNATSDCDWFVVTQGYAGIQGTEFEREFPLAYSLVVHQDAALVERLLRAIYMPHNIYCIHYDLKSSADFISAMKGLARCIPNVFIASKLERVQYAGISRLRADLNCMSDLLDSEVKWKYVINLCGQDFPLRTNAELVSDLKELKGRNMVESKRPGGKKERWSVHHMLKNNNSEYYDRPVSTSEEKSPPPHNIEMFVGSAYFTLSREFVVFVHWSFLARDFLAWSEDTYSPDEHFWATLVRVPGVPGEVHRSDPEISELISKTRLVKWSYLEENLYPPCTGVSVRAVCIYGAAELRWLLNYGHWFANKVDPKVDPVLTECLEEILLEKRPKLQ